MVSGVSRGSVCVGLLAVAVLLSLHALSGGALFGTAAGQTARQGVERGSRALWRGQRAHDSSRDASSSISARMGSWGALSVQTPNETLAPYWCFAGAGWAAPASPLEQLPLEGVRCQENWCAGRELSLRQEGVWVALPGGPATPFARSGSGLAPTQSKSGGAGKGPGARRHMDDGGQGVQRGMRVGGGGRTAGFLNVRGWRAPLRALFPSRKPFAYSAWRPRGGSLYPQLDEEGRVSCWPQQRTPTQGSPCCWRCGHSNVRSSSLGARVPASDVNLGSRGPARGLIVLWKAKHSAFHAVWCLFGKFGGALWGPWTRLLFFFPFFVLLPSSSVLLLHRMPGENATQETNALWTAVASSGTQHVARKVDPTCTAGKSPGSCRDGRRHQAQLGRAVGHVRGGKEAKRGVGHLGHGPLRAGANRVSHPHGASAGSLAVPACWSPAHRPARPAAWPLCRAGRHANHTLHCRARKATMSLSSRIAKSRPKQVCGPNLHTPPSSTALLPLGRTGAHGRACAVRPPSAHATCDVRACCTQRVRAHPKRCRLRGKSCPSHRSGLKHTCARVMDTRHCQSSFPRVRASWAGAHAQDVTSSCLPPRWPGILTHLPPGRVKVGRHVLGRERRVLAVPVGIGPLDRVHS